MKGRKNLDKGGLVVNRRISKMSWIILAALLCLSLVLVPGCTTPSEPEIPPACSDYIGSGQLDGEGIPPDFFSDLNVRVGCCYAFDYDTYIADAFSGQAVQRGSPVVEGLYGYDPDAPMYSYDLTQAEYYLKKAWDGQVWEKGFKFTLLYNAGNLPRKTACEILAEGLAKVNPLFQVSIQPLAWPTILGKIFGTRDMPMFQIGWLPDYPHADNFIVPFMASYGTFSHWQGYGSAELDAQIQAAFQETDPVQQLADYSVLQQRYYDDAPGIMLCQPIVRRYFTDHISGFYYNPNESSYAGRIYDLSKANNGGDIPFKNPGTFVYQTIGEIDSLDPAWIYDTSSAMQVGLMYDTLLYFDHEKTDEFVPMLATEWEFDSTDNTLRFTIRDGVHFHNGDTLTPEDVEYTFERAMVQDRPGGPEWMFFQPFFGDDIYGLDDTTFADIDAAVEVDGNDVVFKLAGAYWQIPFLQILCGQWASIVDKSWCIEQGDWDGTEADVDRVKHPQNAGDTVLFKQVNGTGPWKLDVWEAGIQIKLVKNDDYWRGDVPFDTVITQIVEEWTSRKLALLNGDADLVYVPATQFDEMDDIEEETVGLNVYKNLPSLSIDSFFFNMIICGPQSEE
jgi:ABC-type transport system substrate-binding protein